MRESEAKVISLLEKAVEELKGEEKNDIKEYAGRYYKKEVAEEIGRAIDNCVNSFSLNEMNFAEELCKMSADAKEILDTIIYFFIKSKATDYKAKIYDDRNKRTCEVCSELWVIESECVKGSMIEREISCVEARHKGMYYLSMAIAEKMSNTHRTLQQTFGRVVFNYICVSENEVFKSIAKREVGEKVRGYIPFI